MMKDSYKLDVWYPKINKWINSSAVGNSEFKIKHAIKIEDFFVGEMQEGEKKSKYVFWCVIFYNDLIFPSVASRSITIAVFLSA